MCRLKFDARGQVDSHTVKLKIGTRASVGAHASFLGKALGKGQFYSRFFNGDWPLTGNVLIKVFKVAGNGELMLGRITHFNYMVTAWQITCIRTNSNVEYVLFHVRVNGDIVTIDFRADGLKRTRLLSLRMDDGLDLQSSVKSPIEEPTVVDDFNFLLDVHGAVPVHFDFGLKNENSIVSLRSTDRTTEEHTAEEESHDER